MKARIHFVDRIPVTSRQQTPEGYLRADAAVTRTGVFEYSAAELGLDATDGKSGRVKVMRTPESTFHKDTLASLRGAPITVSHPSRGVSPSNWKGLAVGAVAGEPRVVDNEHVGTSLLIGADEGIKALNDGVEELSIGYDLALVKADSEEYDYVSDGPIYVNHLALVDKGRAGPTVRVFDKGEQMDIAELTKAFKSAMTDALADVLPKPTGAQDANVDSVADKVLAKLTPTIEAMQKVVSDTAEREAQARATADAAAATQAAQAAADALVAQTIKDRDAYHEAVADALPLIPAEQRDAFRGKPIKEILVAAVGDSVPNADALSEDFLRGVIAVEKRNRAASQVHDESYRGHPVGTVPGAVNQNRDTAYKGFIDSFKRDWDNRLTGGAPAA